MKVSKLYWPESNILLWIIWCIFTLLTGYIASRHEPWFDEYHVWYMCKHLKLTWLWSSMMREGHFILWHLLVYPFVKIGCSYWCLQLVSVSLTSVAIWILLMKSPFDIISRFLITFSYPILYLFPVIARCYALVPLLLFITAWLYKIQHKHLYLYCSFVGLIAHTHAYMEGLVGTLFLLFCYEQIYLPYKKNNDVKKAIKAACVTVGIVLLAFFQVSGSLQFANDNMTDRNNNVKELFEGLFLFTTSKDLFIIPGNWHQLFPKFITSSIFYLLIYLSLWVVILYNYIIIFWKGSNNRKFILVFWGALLWQIWMALFVYGFGHQRLFLPMLILIQMLWISYNAKYIKNVLAIVVSLFILTAGHINITRDIDGLFCEDTKLQAFVEKNIPHGESLYFCAYFMKSVEMDLYRNYKIHFTVDATNVTSPEHIDKSFLDKLFSDCNSPNTIYMFTDKIYQNSIGTYKLSLLTNVGKYYLYKTSLAETPQKSN